MHEMGIALQIVEIATASIPEDLKGVPVERIHLKVGKLSAVVPESLRFCFQAASRDTPLADSELVIEEIPVVAKCRQCRQQWTIDGPSFQCKYCQSGAIELLSGRELDIESIEIREEQS